MSNENIDILVIKCDIETESFTVFSPPKKTSFRKKEEEEDDDEMALTASTDLCNDNCGNRYLLIVSKFHIAYFVATNVRSKVLNNNKSFSSSSSSSSSSCCSVSSNRRGFHVLASCETGCWHRKRFVRSCVHPDSKIRGCAWIVHVD